MQAPLMHSSLAVQGAPSARVGTTGAATQPVESSLGTCPSGQKPLPLTATVAFSAPALIDSAPPKGIGAPGLNVTVTMQKSPGASAPPSQGAVAENAGGVDRLSAGVDCPPGFVKVMNCGSPTVPTTMGPNSMLALSASSSAGAGNGVHAPPRQSAVGPQAPDCPSSRSPQLPSLRQVWHGPVQLARQQTPGRLGRSQLNPTPHVTFALHAAP